MDMENIVFLGLTANAWITIVLILGMFLTLIFTKLETWLVFFVTTSLMILTGVLDAKECMAGFSSTSVLVIAVLFVVIAGMTYTGVTQWIVKNLMGSPKSLSGAIVRVMAPVALLSAFLSNTTVVALFIGIVKDWSHKLGIAPSKLLIPLSYASGMGGICTLIGTPPNLIISGMYMEDYPGTHLSIFVTTGVGLFCLVVGILSMLAMQKLLPTRVSADEKLNVQGASTELKVPAKSHLVGQTIGDLKTDLPILGVISFDGEINNNISNDDFLLGGDTLVLGGQRSEVMALAKRTGLEPSIMDMEINPEQGKKTIVSTIIMIAMVALSAFNIMSLFESALVAAGAMLLFRCCTTEQAFRSIDLRVVIIFACSMAFGKALENSGLAAMMSDGLLSVCGTNPYVVLTAICLVGTFATEFISNTACGAMFYPIAVAAATSIGVNPLTFIIALMISVSSSFATPIGSPTHMLVYVPGGYRFTDFMRIGLLMNIIILAANIFITTLLFPL